MFANGSSDVPNAIATCISTRTLDAKKSFILAAIFNSLGVLVMTLISSKVAETVFNIANFGDNRTQNIIALVSALTGIVAWSTLSLHFGIPSSQSHALLAGISGAAIAIKGNFSGIDFNEWKKVIFGLFVFNVLAFLVGYIITKLIEKICKNMDRRKTNKFFKNTQITGALITCFMNGAQDGQKFMAIFLLGIALSKGITEKVGFTVPMWLVFYCSSIIALGAIVGGIKVVKTVGTKVAKIERYQGTAADLSSAICLFVASLFGVPVSSTHVKNSSIMGVGASKRISNVNWIVAKNMVLTWIITFPCCGILGYSLTKIFIKFNV